MFGGLGGCLKVWGLLEVWVVVGGLGGCWEFGGLLEVWVGVWGVVGGLGRCMGDEEGDLLGLLVESDVIVRNSDPLLHVGEQLFPPL